MDGSKIKPVGHIKVKVIDDEDREKSVNFPPIFRDQVVQQRLSPTVKSSQHAPRKLNLGFEEVESKHLSSADDVEFGASTGIEGSFGWFSNHPVATTT